MSRIGPYGQPGVTAAVFNQTREIFWGGDLSKIEILQSNSEVDAAAVDAGATVTSTLRPGLIMGKVTASGQLRQWDATATDGTQVVHSVNREELSTLDAYGSTRDLFGPTIFKAPLKASQLLIKGVALVGHADEYLARRALHAMGCRLDDDPWGVLAGAFERTITKATNYTVVAADNGMIFQQITADATFTLPAIKAGLRFKFLQTADFEIVVASAEGDNMVVGNDLSANSITFTTAGQQIGVQIEVEAMYVNGTLKWVPTLPYVPFGTGLATLAFAIAT